MKPSFLIIGGVKCASSSLYRYLNGHPQVLPCKTKEPGYLNNRNILKLISGYRNYISLFPDLTQERVDAEWLEIGKDSKMKSSVFCKEIEKGRKYITGEATATTFVEANPKIIKTLFPKIKIILSFRNPTERFISHFSMYKRFEKEGKSGHQYGTIEEFVNKEIEAYRSGMRTKVLHQGVYIKYLPKWKKVFGKNIKIIYSHQLQDDDASKTIKDIFSFLELENFDLSTELGVKHNVSPTKASNAKVKAKLDEFYHPYNLELLDQYQITV